MLPFSTGVYTRKYGIGTDQPKDLLASIQTATSQSRMGITQTAKRGCRLDRDRDTNHLTPSVFLSLVFLSLPRFLWSDVQVVQMVSLLPLGADKPVDHAGHKDGSNNNRCGHGILLRPVDPQDGGR